MTSATLDDILARLNALPETERAAVVAAAAAETQGMPWLPTPGPQSEAYFSPADDLFYGGSAGGGKSDLAVGLALTAHTRSLILRREREQVGDLFDRCGEVLDTTEGRNGQQLRWDTPDKRMIRFGGCKQEKDKQKYKGRPYDLIVFDEGGDFLKSQFLFIKTWNRSAKPGQRCRVVVTGNPPTTAEGLWLIEYWAPWLDPRHPNPAKPGELRWYTTDKNDVEREVDGPGPHRIEHDDGTVEHVRARSRTFIRARLDDNPYLANTDYGANLDALPAEIRRAYRDGRFDLSLEDDLWQTIKTSWVMAAIERGKAHPRPPAGVPMTAMGVDPAQGGKDETVIAVRYGGWYAPMVAIPGAQTPDGKTVAFHVITHRRDNAVVVVDMGGGYGGSTKETLEDNHVRCVGYKGALDSTAVSVVGKMSFKNKRTEAYWRFREALDPDQPGGSVVCLPDDPKLIADLTAPKYEVKRGNRNKLTVIVEFKENVVERLGRSTDRGDAVVMAATEGDAAAPYPLRPPRAPKGGNVRPLAKIGYANRKRRRG